MKTCAKCQETKPLDAFGQFVRQGRWLSVQSYCKPCRVHLQNERKRANPEAARASQKRAKLRQNYGITIDEREAQIAAQGGCCAICQKSLAGLSPHTIHVDHDHATGALRGVLCGPCNAGLGSFRDDENSMLAAIRYLRSGGVWQRQEAA